MTKGGSHPLGQLGQEWSEAEHHGLLQPPLGKEKGQTEVALCWCLLASSLVLFQGGFVQHHICAPGIGSSPQLQTELGLKFKPTQ